MLLVIDAAVRQHGSPEALVTDGGGVFRAKQALAIFAALGIRKEQIAKRQPWQSLIETQFNVQRRMADWPFAQAATWADLLAAHDRTSRPDTSQEGVVAACATASARSLSNT